MRTALLFPGQGAPAADWREPVERHCPDLLEHARQLLEGADPFERFGEGTEFDQPAIYCASLTAFEVAGRPAAGFHAGHSLGEIAALACAGAFDEHDGLRLVVERGRLMADAARRSGAGAMLAVAAPVDQLTKLIGQPKLAIANVNSPSQTVLSGATAAIEAAASELRDRRIRTKRLAVSGAFHTAAMAPAALALGRALERTEVAEPQVPVLSGRTAEPFTDVRTELAASLLDPVRWIDVVAALEREGVQRFVEIGPGRALIGLVRRSLADGAEIELIATEPTHA